jgi:serine/threonine-protein kinase
VTNAAALSPPAPDAPPSAWIGHTLDGRYKIRDLLGEGGMGAVFVAEQVNLGKLVALKMIHGEYADNEELAARFRREAMATAQIDHPNVASAVDYGQRPGGGAYLVTQLVRGPSLAAEIARGKMAWGRACELGAQIADALTAAHAAGIVHRDLKPDNILLEQREGATVVKVLDFGIARMADPSAGAQPLTRLGTVMGTPGYMAPEQAMGEPTDHRTDLYALGVILWECLAGRPLWDGGELSDMLTRQLTQPPPPLAGEVPDLPPELELLTQRLLAREAKQRPATAREVRDTLRALARGGAATVPLSAPPRPTAPQRGLGAFLGVFALAAVLIVAVWWATQPPSSGAGPAAPASDGPPAAFVPASGPKPPVPADKSEAPGPTGQPTPPAEAALPAALAGHAETLLDLTAKGRFKAAEAVLAHEPAAEVPAWLRGLALLEKAESCDAKRAAVKRIAEAGDKRGLPTLQALAKTPRKGCGTFKNNDCLDCMRQTLKNALEELGG